MFQRRINRITYLAGFMLSLAVVGIIANLIPNKSQITDGIIIVIAILYTVCLQRMRSRDVVKDKADLPFKFLFYEPSQKKPNKYGKPPKPGIDWKGLLGI